MFLLYLVVYLLTVYVGYKFITTTDMQKEVGFKGKCLVMLWFTFFITSQMLMFQEIASWFGFGVIK